MKRFSSKSGFTLIELLAVIAIVIVLAAITLSVLSSVRRSAGKAQLSSNLRQACVGLLTYVADHKGVFPGSSGYNDYAMNSWQAEIAAYVGEDARNVGVWASNVVIEKSVLHDPLDRTQKTTGSLRLVRNIAINGVNSKGQAAEGIVNRPLNTIGNPSRLMALTTGKTAEAGDEYSLGVMRIRGSYYLSTAERETYTRVSGQYYCAFADGHVGTLSDAILASEAEKNNRKESILFDGAANDGVGR